ncbi:MAG: hypothetical protein SV760_03100, partial [Halobacteria archaeon]|nr:hypothetical protein [Halobacteria archaeon]
MPDGILHLIFLAQTGVLVITSLLIIYPLVSHARNVAYTEGLVLLSVTLLLLTLLSVLDVIYGAELVAN